MWTESEIQNCKKIFVDELGCYSQKDKAEKMLDELFEKVRSQDFYDLDSICEKLEMEPELAAFFKDNFVHDPALSFEEHFKNGVRIGKEFYRIEEKKH